MRAPEWREAGRRVALRDPSRGVEVGLRPWSRAVLEGVARGASVEEMTRAAASGVDPKKLLKARRRVRQLLFNLAGLGFLEILIDEPPAVFAGRYRRVKELGRGGVGIAWLCRDEAAGRDVVVKRAWDFLQPFRVTEAAMRREADVLRALDHPGVVRVLDSFEDGGHLHVVREFVEGAPLDRLAPVADAKTRRELAAGVAVVVAHLHERGFLMIDLRPANFLASDRVRLLDVGGAREHAGGEVSFRKPVGSPGFISPEMELRRVADVRSDVWGVGRLLHFLGTGQRPSKTADAAEVAARSVPEDRALVRCLCADEPADRPATMAEAAALLRAGE